MKKFSFSWFKSIGSPPFDVPIFIYHNHDIIEKNFEKNTKEGPIVAFIDKLGQVANKVGEVAGDTFDYSKAKGKAVLEKGR